MKLARVLVPITLLTACAATQPVTVEDCSLDDETACVEYAASSENAPQSPHGQLVTGLAERARHLEEEAAFDYHLRIVELVEASDSVDPRAARDAVASFMVLAEHDLRLLDEFEWGADLDGGLDEVSELQARLQSRAEFVVNHGDPEQKAVGAWTIARSFDRQANLLTAVEVPAELTPPAKVAFRQKLDGLAKSLSEEADRFRRGVVTHCTRRGLTTTACEAAGRNGRNRGHD